MSARNEPKAELYQDKAKLYRWRLKASNGKVVADCGEGYSTKRRAVAGLEAARKALACARVLDLTVG